MEIWQIVLVIILVIIVGYGIYYFVFKKDNKKLDAYRKLESTTNNMKPPVAFLPLQQTRTAPALKSHSIKLQPYKSVNFVKNITPQKQTVKNLSSNSQPLHSLRTQNSKQDVLGEGFITKKFENEYSNKTHEYIEIESDSDMD